MHLDVNFCKDHRGKTEVPDPLAVENLISYKLNSRRKLARLITQYGNIFSSWYFERLGLPFSRCCILRNTLKKEGCVFRNIGKYIPILCYQPCSFSSINAPRPQGSTGTFMSDKNAQKVRKVKADVHNIVSTRTNFVKICLWLVSLVVLSSQGIVWKWTAVIFLLRWTEFDMTIARCLNQV